MQLFAVLSVNKTTVPVFQSFFYFVLVSADARIFMSLLFLTLSQTGTRQYDSFFFIFILFLPKCNRGTFVFFAVFIILFCLFFPGTNARINALNHFSTKTELAEILCCLHRQMHVKRCETLCRFLAAR